MITLSSTAQEKLKEIISEGDDMKLRIFVQGGGCSGFTYGFTLTNECAEDDMIFTFDVCDVVVDTTSLQYIEGSEIHYDDDLMSCSFVVRNPNAESTCGCGSSFSPAMM